MYQMTVTMYYIHTVCPSMSRDCYKTNGRNAPAVLLYEDQGFQSSLFYKQNKIIDHWPVFCRVWFRKKKLGHIMILSFPSFWKGKNETSLQGSLWPSDIMAQVIQPIIDFSGALLDSNLSHGKACIKVRLFEPHCLMNIANSKIFILIDSIGVSYYVNLPLAGLIPH